MLDKNDVLQAAKLVFLVDDTRRTYLKVVDYSNNPIAPEKVAYKFYFYNLMGQREKTMYWPNTVGFQVLR